jgi:hypothetical protein
MAKTRKEGDPPNGLKQQIGAGNVLQDPNPNYPPINIHKNTPTPPNGESEESGSNVPNLVEHAVRGHLSRGEDLSQDDFDLGYGSLASQRRATPKAMEKMDIKKAQPIDTSGSRPKREVKALPEPPKPKHKLSPKEVITNIKLGINDVRQRNEESRSS